VPVLHAKFLLVEVGSQRALDHLLITEASLKSEPTKALMLRLRQAKGECSGLSVRD
jgi:hypothetical protein